MKCPKIYPKKESEKMEEEQIKYLVEYWHKTPMCQWVFKTPKHLLLYWGLKEKPKQKGEKNDRIL